METSVENLLENSTEQVEFRPSEKGRVKRGRKLATYNKVDIFKLIDELKFGHMGFISEGQAIVIPMTFWRVGEDLYFHTLNKSRLDKLIQSGAEICVSFAETSEWVLSKSAYHTSVNYRSAVVFCTGSRVESQEDFNRSFKSIIDDIEPGRWNHIRPPNVKERKATALLKLTIIEGSYKCRSGGPNEEVEDLDLPVWNGTVPIDRESRKAGVCPFHRE